MIAPPQKNLGAGDEWGRWVEQELGVADKSSVQVSQGIDRSLMSVNSTLTQLTKQLQELPIITTLTSIEQTIKVPKAPSGATQGAWTEVNRVSFSMPEGKTRLSLVVSAYIAFVTNGLYPTFGTRFRVLSPTFSETYVTNRELSRFGETGNLPLQVSSRSDVMDFSNVTGGVTIISEVMMLSPQVSSTDHAENIAKLSVLSVASNGGEI